MKHLHHLLKSEHHSPLIEFLKIHAGKMGRSLVAIGWDNDKPSRQWIDFFQEDLGFERVLIIEAYQSNVKTATRHYKDQPQVSVVWNSIQNAVDDPAIWEPGYDACIWSHGPEHVGIEEHPILLPKLFRRLNKLFLAWMPWGNHYGEDADNPNPWQRHRVLVPTPVDFEALNLNMNIGTCDTINSQHALVWIYKWLLENKNET